MKILLDTNAYNAFRRGEQPTVDAVKEASSLIMSTIVLGELHFGFRNGSRYSQNLRILEDFLENPFVEVAGLTSATAEMYGLLATSLRRKGRPIPTNDIWIAAHTFETQAVLATFDGHFTEIENLRTQVLLRE